MVTSNLTTVEITKTTIPRTGSEVGESLLVSSLLMLIGLMLVMLASRRRRWNNL